MADGNGHRHRFGAIVFGLVVAAAALAVFPATAPLGMTLCLFLVIPAIVAVWRTRRAPVGTRRRSVAALVVAPVFLLVGAGVMPHPPVPAAVVEAAPAATSVAGPTSEPTTVAPATIAPTTVAPAPAPGTGQVVVAAVPAPVAVARVAAPAAPAPVVVPRTVAPRTAAPKAKPAAPKPAAPAPVASGSSCGANSYVNSSGNCVPRPVAAATAPAGATAQCKDGAYSFSQHRSGTCSGHGGVQRWL